MYDLRNVSGSQHLRAAGIVLLGALCAFQVRAAPFTSTTSGNSTTFAPGTYARDAAAVGASLAISAGVVYATQPATLKTLAGAVAPLVVRAAPVAGAIGSAVAGCFANPLCVLVTAGAAAYVANELSYSYDASTGVPVVRFTPAPGTGYYWPDSCGVANCSNIGVVYSTVQAACNQIKFQGSGGWSASGNYCQKNGYNWEPVRVVNKCFDATGAAVAPVNGVCPSILSGAQQLADAIGAKNGWSSDSKIIELLEKIVRNTNQSIPLQIPSVTGPTSIADAPTVETKADGSKVATTKTTSIGYFGPTATTTETTVTKTTTPDGVETTQKTVVGPAPVKDEAPATDYDVPADEIPKTKKTITFAAENLGFAGGSCPANVMQTVHGKSIKLIDWTSNCNYVTTYAKPMILAAATFAALMLIFVGGKPE